MASTGNVRVNGGYIDGQEMAVGDMLFFCIGNVTGGVGSGFDGRKAKLVDGYLIADAGLTGDGVPIAEGQSIPYSAAEVVYNVLSKRCTPIALNIDQDGIMHIIAENNVTAWYQNKTGDSTGPTNPGIAPVRSAPTIADLIPKITADIRALGTMDLNDGGLATGTSAYDFSAVAATFDNSLRLDYANMEFDDGGPIAP